VIATTAALPRPAVLPRLNTLQAGRVLPIDAFRGLTFLVMVWVNEMHGVTGISNWWKHMPADADAMSFVDVVFPAFLFIVGMSIPFAVHARIAKGDGWLALQGHIAWRALALVVMGVFMVNAETGSAHAASMALPIEAWSLLFYSAVGLVWGVYRAPSPALDRALRGSGIALMVALALLYRGGPDGSQGLTPQWWGILGLIGWAYLIGSMLYQLSRGRVAVLWLMLAGCVAYYAGHAALGDDAGGLAATLLSQDAHAAHTSIVLAGVICALLYHERDQAPTLDQRHARALAMAAALLVAGFALRPWFPISKIYATPSWCLLSAAACVLAYALLQALIVQIGATGWVAWVEPAANNPLVTYLLPFVVGAVMGWAGWRWPSAFKQGTFGIVFCALYAGAVLWAVGRLTRWNVRLKL
jgi:heparan-alpha-glucosaminide N-acetyltransferase